MSSPRLDGYVTALEHAFKVAGLSAGPEAPAAAPAIPPLAETLRPEVRAYRPTKKPLGVSRA